MIYSPFLRYKWNLGMISWILGRLSGLVLAGYLIAHILTTCYLSKGPQSFNDVMKLLHNPYVKLLEVCLLGTVVYHAVNGFKVILLNLGAPSKYHKVLFWITTLFGMLIFTAGAIPLLLSAWRIL